MIMSEHTYESWDGTQLFYRAWIPSGPPADKALLLFHRGHEHSGRWQETACRLNLDKTAIFAWDARGHGKSPGPRGHAGSLSVLVKDADHFARHVAKIHGISTQDTVVLAHSVGAVIATAWVHDYAPMIRGIVLAVPAFRVKLYVPLAIPFLRLRERMLPGGEVKSYVKAQLLTHDFEQTGIYRQDQQIFRQISIKMLLDLFDTSTRLLRDAGSITVPALILGAGSDWVVKMRAQRQFFHGLSSKVKKLEVLPGFYHAIFHEKDRELVFEKTREFIMECFSRPPGALSLADADRQGFTKEEYDRLKSPVPFRWKLVKLGMKTFGKLSNGIRLGWNSGFDSGVTLDYIYNNQSAGRLLLGKWFDRAYLDSIGWRGIRIRRIHIESLLRNRMEQLHQAGRPVRILDVACGAGRYVLECMANMSRVPCTALLRDYKEENLAAARRIAAGLGLGERVIIEHGDAFDRSGLAAITPRPTIGIVSGLFELFPENEPLRHCLAGLADVIEPGGFLIYTNQPWHPQLEFISRVLTNREGKPWIMRRRTQAEMDELVRAAGFEKACQETDEWGIFTVSTAVRQ